MAAGGHPTNAAHSAPLGFLQQMIQERNNQQNLPGMQTSPMVVNPTPTQENNPIKSLLRQLNVHANGHPQVPVDSVWPQPPPPHIATQFNAQNWLAQVTLFIFQIAFRRWILFSLIFNYILPNFKIQIC